MAYRKSAKTSGGQQEPVAAAGEAERAMELTRILVAVDGSDNGYRAVETAVNLAKDYQAELIILRVVTPPVLTSAGNRSGGSAIIKEFYDSEEKDAKGYVAALVEEAKNRGVLNVKGELVREASPVPVIADKAKNEKADLVVIGTRGLDKTKRLLLGSVSAGIVANSDVQVLVVR